MFKKKLDLYLMAIVYSISLGSLIFIWPNYRELFVFLQIITLPSIYFIGYEILMEKQKKEMKEGINIINRDVDRLLKEKEKLKAKLKGII